ncbi:ADP-ribose pyrophosphatase YjhB (NUDIX family) [Desulfomicrobium macestii]|uniref:ADP-ribose pyrophosphatase YjhB, NUDIX family n=2 Tax=Desulfomicrobium TaxID=898 RepID=A0A8G2C2P8_DESNO|nr:MULTISPECIES: NUDIX hydrolase [Desulfomicrobium]MBE1427090.1 ADP-ribose pyrophosphatase YjhB (NUDIX family) [Desulfomicrobium macestii]SFL70284.1 ADP-ribose pyrophosphatase YjhB, NUDIX family [Desulfomicrobium norvegicum]
MTDDSNPRWLDWAREIQSLAQTGLAFTKSHYDQLSFGRLSDIAAEILAEHSQLEASAVKRAFSLEPGYATPKVDVRAAVIRDGHILLVRESADGRWAMPGGWADVGDRPSQTAEREALEESGFVVRATKLVAAFDANRGKKASMFFHAVKLIFLCELLGGEARGSMETLEVDFFDFDNLPPLSEQRTNQRHLEEIRAHLRDPLRPAAFD